MSRLMVLLLSISSLGALGLLGASIYLFIDTPNIECIRDYHRRLNVTNSFPEFNDTEQPTLEDWMEGSGLFNETQNNSTEISSSGTNDASARSVVIGIPARTVPAESSTFRSINYSKEARTTEFPKKSRRRILSVSNPHKRKKRNKTKNEMQRSSKPTTRARPVRPASLVPSREKRYIPQNTSELIPANGSSIQIMKSSRNQSNYNSRKKAQFAGILGFTIVAFQILINIACGIAYWKQPRCFRSNWIILNSFQTSWIFFILMYTRPMDCWNITYWELPSWIAYHVSLGANILLLYVLNLQAWFCTPQKIQKK